MKVCSLARTKVWMASCVLLLITACSTQPTRVAEKPIDSHASIANAAPRRSSVPSPPPTPIEVHDAVARVLGTNVVVLGNKPIALTGDFNGDTYSDLVVAVKPVPKKLNEINAELANWQIQNPRRAYVPPKHATVAALPKIPKAEKVKSGETLLVVIHGDGSAGWRDPLALQTYLLREAVGNSFETSKPSPALMRDFGQFPSPRDVISEKLQGRRGVIYWTGASYAWHEEEQETGLRRRLDSERSAADRLPRSVSMSLRAGSDR